MWLNPLYANVQPTCNKSKKKHVFFEYLRFVAYQPLEKICYGFGIHFRNSQIRSKSRRNEFENRTLVGTVRSSNQLKFNFLEDFSFATCSQIVPNQLRNAILAQDEN